MFSFFNGISISFSFLFCRDKLLVPEIEKQKRTDVEMDVNNEEKVRLTNDDNKNVEIVASK